MDIEDIIRRGDRADFKKWLADTPRDELLKLVPKLITCTVQDFGDLAMKVLRERKIVR